MKLARLKDQPAHVEIYADDDLFCRLEGPLKAGTFLPQHSHEYDHVTLLLVGSVDVQVDGGPLVRYHAPKAIPIKAGTKHLFKALVDGTMLACVHNLHGKGYPGIAEEHKLI